MLHLGSWKVLLTLKHEWTRGLILLQVRGAHAAIKQHTKYKWRAISQYCFKHIYVFEIKTVIGTLFTHCRIQTCISTQYMCSIIWAKWVYLFFKLFIKQLCNVYVSLWSIQFDATSHFWSLKTLTFCSVLLEFFFFNSLKLVVLVEGCCEQKGNNNKHTL